VTNEGKAVPEEGDFAPTIELTFGCDSRQRELHRLGFEQLTMEMTGTSDTSQHRPIFR
jgi:hypothetical protein